MFELFEKTLIDDLTNSNAIDFTRDDSNLFVMGRIYNGAKSYGTISIESNASINSYKLKIRPYRSNVRQRSMDVSVVNGLYDIEKIEKWILKFVNDAKAKLEAESESQRKEHEAHKNYVILMNDLLSEHEGISYNEKNDRIVYNDTEFNYSLVNEVIHVKLVIGECSSFTKYIKLDEAISLIDSIFS